MSTTRPCSRIFEALVEPTTRGNPQSPLRWTCKIAQFAYAAALIFTAASGTTNLLYGWNKGTDFGSSLVWATVSLGVSIVFSLSWPAFIRATDDKQNVRAFDRSSSD